MLLAWLASHPCLEVCGGRPAESAPDLDFLPAIFPGSLDLPLGVMGILSCILRCLFMEWRCLPSRPASATRQPLSLAFPFSLARLACPTPILSRSLQLLASAAQLRSPCWPRSTWPHLTHCSCQFVRHHCAFVYEAHSGRPGTVSPGWRGSPSRVPSRDLAVVWQGRAGMRLGAPCPPLPGHPLYHMGLDAHRGATSQGM